MEKGAITSRELLKIINELRVKEGKSILEHYQLTRKIRDELTADKIIGSRYKDESGKENKELIMNFNQARQVATRESKTIRKAIFKKDRAVEVFRKVRYLYTEEMRDRRNLLGLGGL